MKLKEFNADNCASAPGGKSPTVALNTKTGLFRINKEACVLMDLSANDQIKFHQDEEEEGDWYIEKVKEGGFVLREKETITKGLIFCSSHLAKKIAESVSFSGQSGNCLVAGKPTEFQKRKLFGLLTATLRNQ
jgi:hypothetical protein